jgi:hypothetical protein
LPPRPEIAEAIPVFQVSAIPGRFPAMYLCSWFLVDVVFAWDGPSYNIAYYLVIHPGQFKSVGTVADPTMCEDLDRFLG